MASCMCMGCGDEATWNHESAGPPAAHLDLEHGHVGLGHRLHLCHVGALLQHVLQAVRAAAEEVRLALAVCRAHAQRVDVSACVGGWHQGTGALVGRGPPICRVRL
jgi:hypothetical protein